MALDDAGKTLVAGGNGMVVVYKAKSSQSQFVQVAFLQLLLLLLPLIPPLLLQLPLLMLLITSMEGAREDE